MKIKIMIILASLGILSIVVQKPYMDYKYAHVWGKSIVRLLGSGGGGTGSQIEYRGHQFILTNDHVCGLADADGRILIDTPWAEITIGHVLYRSAYTDLCLISPHPDLPALHIGKMELKKHEGFVILGHPKLGKLHASPGMVMGTEMMDVNVGLIMTEEDAKACSLPKNRKVELLFGLFKYCLIHVRAQDTTALIKPGNSGSPVLDSKGEVRGVAFAAASSGRHKDQAAIIPYNDMVRFLNAAHKSSGVPKMHRHP